ncbi:hypothetical protein ACE6H2_009861 [Prunus campanulata]
MHERERERDGKSKKKGGIINTKEANIFTKTSQLVFSHANHKNAQTTNKQLHLPFHFYSGNSAALVIFCSF